MLERFRSSVRSFSICLMRLCTCEARVPAWKRATKSCSWAIFFFFSDDFGLDAAAQLGLLVHHVVVAARVLDDRLVVDVRDVRADLVEEVPVVADGDQHALVLV